MSGLQTLAWATDHADPISAVGALILFFSWVAMNTLAERYTRAKASVENAQSTFRLYSTLNELRDQLNSLAMEVVQQGYGADASRFRSGMTSDAGLNEARIGFDSARLVAHQVKGLDAFTNEAYAFCRQVGAKSAVAEELGVLLTETGSLRQELRERESAAELHHTNAPTDRDQFIVKSREYVTFVRRDAVPRVGSLLKRAVQASGTCQDEGRAALESARRRDHQARRIANILYVAGSFVALGGQFLKAEAPSDAGKAKTGSSPTASPASSAMTSSTQSQGISK